MFDLSMQPVSTRLSTELNDQTERDYFLFIIERDNE